MLLVAAALTGCDGANWKSGDRVLVGKCLYDTGLERPARFDVVVFKFPQKPVENGSAKNYIKRLLGLPGELLALLFGRVFVMNPEEGEPLFPPPHVVTTKDGLTREGFLVRKDDKSVVLRDFDGEREETFRPDEVESVVAIPPEKLRAPRYMLEKNVQAVEWFRAGKFRIVRKPPSVMLATRRIVYDNDYPAKDLEGPRWQRWLPEKESGWESDGKNGFRVDAGKEDAAVWLRYRHILRPKEGPVGGAQDPQRQLITDELGYNSIVMVGNHSDQPDPNWVGDLMVECKVETTRGDGEFLLELARGVDRFQAQFQIGGGLCTLYRIGADGKKVEVASASCALKGTGTRQIRFANFTSRLTVWVDGELPFGPGADYAPPELRQADEKDLDAEGMAQRLGPTKNDLQPASIGSAGAGVQVSQIRLWRDTYYTQAGQQSDLNLANAAERKELARAPFFNPQHRGWNNFRRMDPLTMYVQKEHLLCLGDNSTKSYDGRDWGLVPERLLLGRALLVYYPIGRAGPIR